MKRLLWAIWWAGFLFVLIILACLGLVLGTDKPPKLHEGNFLCSKCFPPRQGGKTKMAVFGDTQKGLAGFAALAELAKAEDIDLAIHTGDLVSHADVGHYDLALKWVERARLGVPFVVAPGNHDIKDGAGLFEEQIGHRQFAFRWGPVDIVVVDNAVAPPGEAAVEKLLAAAKGPILLFMHVPPHDTTKNTLVPKSTYTCFLEMIRKYPVRYVFSGHAHGYSRIEDGGIVYIANGVGGDSDSWQFDQKACMTIVEATTTTVEGAPVDIQAREISIEPVFGLQANVEHLAIGHVGEIMLRTPWGIPALLLLILILALIYRRLRRKKEKVPEPEKEPEKLEMKFTSAKTSEPPDIVI